MANTNTDFMRVAQTISNRSGMPLTQVMADLQAGLRQKQQQRGLTRLRGYGDGLSSILPDTSTTGLFDAPAVALYSFGAVILGIGLFLAWKKK